MCTAFAGPSDARRQRSQPAIRAAADAGVVAMNLSLSGSSVGNAEAGAIDYALF